MIKRTHIIGLTESRANNYIAYAELGLVGYVMFRKDIMGRRGGGVLVVCRHGMTPPHMREGAAVGIMTSHLLLSLTFTSK